MSLPPFLLTCLLIALLVGALSGCVSTPTARSDAEVVSSATYAEASQAARQVAASFVRAGYKVTVYDGSRGSSMGQIVSNHAFLVVVRCWDSTPIASVVTFSKVMERQATTPNGKPYVAIGEKRLIIHQLAQKQADLARTRGVNNGGADRYTIGPDEYEGTLVAQIYYNPNTKPK